MCLFLCALNIRDMYNSLKCPSTGQMYKIDSPGAKTILKQYVHC